MAKIYISLEFDGGDLTYNKDLKSITGVDRQAAFTLILEALHVYLQAFTPEMRHAWEDLYKIRHLFMLHTEKLPVPTETAPSLTEVFDEAQS